MRSCKSAILAVACLVLLHATLVPGARAEELRPGDVLGPDNWELAKGLLPPEILKFYEKGEYRSKIAEWPEGRYRRDDSFVANTERNRGKYTVNEVGSIVEKASGKPAPPIYGLPFPDIDPNDPDAGVKVLWNHYYDYWNQGNYFNRTQIVWLSRSGVDRTATQEVSFLYYEAQPPKYCPAKNPRNLIWQFLAETTAPADLHGITALSWRFKDPDRRDALWTYVPALRRVREVSPANRSDGFLGSDLSQDDGPFFDGKPEDFRWRLVGEKEVLVFTDPLSGQPGASSDMQLPGGGWRDIWPKIKVVGYQDPSWKGVPWAPLAPTLSRRKCWVIEGVPKDKYYLYGKIQLYVVKDVYQGAFNRKFDWKGELLNTYQVIIFPVTRPLGGTEGEYNWSSGMNYRCAYNVKLDRATYPHVQAAEDWPSDRRIPLEPHFFDYQNLLRMGK